MSIVFGTKIRLRDHNSPITENTAIGLYNCNATMTASPSADDTSITVEDNSLISPLTIIKVSDGTNSEEAFVVSLTGTTQINLASGLENGYDHTDGGRVDADSEFRWISNAVSGLSNWQHGMIIERGNGTWTREINLDYGGDVARPGASSVTIKNTDQFQQTVADLAVYFPGMQFERFEFADTTPTRRWVGECRQPIWDATRYMIPAEGRRESSVANILTPITRAAYAYADADILGKAIPATFGEIRPLFDSYGNTVYNGYAKFVRTANRTEKITSDMFDRYGYSVYNIAGQTIFPVISPVESTAKILLYSLRMGPTLIFVPTIYPDLTEDCYIRVVEGKGAGQTRKITALEVATGDPTIIIGIDDYFPETLQGNLTATAENQSWVEIIRVKREYRADTKECKAYLDESGNEIDSSTDKALELYSYVSDSRAKVTVESLDTETIGKVITAPPQFYRLPSFAYTESADSTKNRLVINPKLFGTDTDTLDAFLILPASGVYLETATNLSKWGYGSTVRKLQNGLFVDPISSPNYPGDAELTVAAGTLANVIDKNSTTYIRYQITGAATFAYVLAIIAARPPCPKNFEFDSVYFGVKLKHYTYNDGTPLLTDKIRWRRFIGPSSEILESQGDSLSEDRTIDNLPDFYYLDGPSTNNENFYFLRDNALGVGGFGLYRYNTGYTLFEIANVNTEALYNGIYEVAILLSDYYGNVASAPNVDLYEIAFIFRKSVSVKDAIFAPMKGRIYGDTWGSRKTAAGMIESPVDMLEALCRLQAWPSTSPVATGGWGKAYADNALVKTSGDGSFDDTTDPVFAATKSLKTARQILEYSDGYTPDLKASLCRCFGLVNWVDANGYECVKAYHNYVTTPSDTVTLADIIDRSAIRITEPNPQKIITEPFVRYNKNYATGEYEGIIRITNAAASTFAAAYVEGKTGAEAQAYWTKCHNLYLKTGQSPNPPSSFTDLDWVNGPDADSIAWNYLTRQIDSMHNPVVSFPVHYNKAKTWEEAKRFILQLPHQTNNVQIECIVTKLTFDPNPPYGVTVEAIVLKSTTALYELQDTWATLGDDYMWVDTMTVYNNDNDKVDTM